jgi:hypothetical protein
MRKRGGLTKSTKSAKMEKLAMLGKLVNPVEARQSGSSGPACKANQAKEKEDWIKERGGRRGYLIRRRLEKVHYHHMVHYSANG